jgi:hypothetical protein
MDNEARGVSAQSFLSLFFLRGTAICTKLGVQKSVAASMYEVSISGHGTRRGANHDGEKGEQNIANHMGKSGFFLAGGCTLSQSSLQVIFRNRENWKLRIGNLEGQE